jgi:two-component system osmolarity sensor histidine kinase EnvZ
MADQEGVRILPASARRLFELLEQNALGQKLTEELTTRSGYGTVVARSVNGEPGPWVGFTINGDRGTGC